MTRLVAVTGASGFIGRHLSTQLAARGFEVRAIVRPSPVPLRRHTLHPEVAVSVTVNVARNADEAERQARGEAVPAAEAAAAEETEQPPGVGVEAFFEKPQAPEADQGEGAEKAG